MSKQNTAVAMAATTPGSTIECERYSPAKWNVVVNDVVIPAPDQEILIRVLKHQAGVPADHVLVRDHGSEHDVPIEDDAIVDLAEGNVFYTIARCDYRPRGGCTAPAKLAWFIDDVAEITLRSDQTGRTLRELFGLTVAVRLFRDYESPRDESAGPDAKLPFAEGPVFYTRRAEAGLTISVNKQTFGSADGVKPEMTGREIGNLITDQPCEVKHVVAGNEVIVGLDETVKIRCGEEFTVIRCNVVGGYEAARIERDLTILRENGAEADLITAPVGAVVFRDVPTRSGFPGLSKTDVLVVIPSAFPGAMLDGAYLPEGSPLLGKVAGQPKQGTLQAAGRTWELVSYHPHNGGGASAWNPNRHGFHTYYSEVLSWIHNAAN